MWWRKKKGKWGLPVQYEEGFEEGAAWMLSLVANAFEDSASILDWFTDWHSNLEMEDSEKYKEGVQYLQRWLLEHRR